jgi:hypothetical protein
MDLETWTLIIAILAVTIVPAVTFIAGGIAYASRKHDDRIFTLATSAVTRDEFAQELGKLREHLVRIESAVQRVGETGVTRAHGFADQEQAGFAADELLPAGQSGTFDEKEVQ